MLMSNLAIKDTHAFISLLQAKGASKELAEGVAEAVQQYVGVSDQLATKEDTSSIQLEVKSLEVRLVRWMATMFIGQFLVTVGTLATLYSLFG